MIAKGTDSTEGVYNGTTEIRSIYKGTSLRYKNWVTKQGVPPLTLSKCKNTNMLGYEVYGNSKQPTYTGKNLWDKVSSYTGGTTEQIESNALNSTKTYTISFDVSSDYQVVGNGDYIFSLRLNGSGRQNIYNTDFTAGQRFSQTFTSIDLVRFTNQYFYSGTLSNIMIEQGSSATLYEPYVGSTSSQITPAPNPNYPQEIESVGDIKNLWNSTLIAGCMKFADGQYLNYPGYVCNATPIPVEAGETYTISATNYTDPESTSTGFVFYNNGTFVSSLITTSLTVTIPTGVNQLYYDFRKQSSASSLSPSDITNVQLEKGSTATTYEPYGYKIPITVSGKNLVNVNDSNNHNGYLNNQGVPTDTARTDLQFSDFIPIDTTQSKITISGMGESVMVAPSTCFYDKNKVFISGVTFDYAITKTFDIPANAKYFRTSWRTAYTEFMAEYGSEKTTYEAYRTNTVNIYLDAPLRKIGNYNDYIDLETQKVYRNIGHIDLGSPTYTYQSQYTRFRSDTIPGLKIVTGDWTYDLKCDIYGTTLAQNFNIGAQGGAAFIWDNRYSDATALKTALKGHYLEYALNTQTETSITLPNILLNKGTNIISIDTNINASNLWIKYKGKE